MELRLCFTGYLPLGVGTLNGYHRAGWILRYLENPLSTEELKKIVDAGCSARPFFHRGPVEFDSSALFFENLHASLKSLIEDGFVNFRDGEKFIRNLNIDFELQPFKSVESFIESRRSAVASQVQSSIASQA